MSNDLDIALKLSAQTDGFNKGVDVARSAVTALVAAMAAIGLGFSAKEFIDIADATQQMASRIKNATANTEEYNLVQDRLLKLANSTYRPLAEAQEVYLSTAATMKSLGYTTEQTLAVTESLSLSFTANATSSDKAQAAQDAFSKSLAKGGVDADAWASILDGADNIVGDLAKTTGKTESEILKMGASGTLSVNDLAQAFIDSKDRNQELADAMSTSTADATTYLKNNIAALIGKLNEQYDMTGKLSSVLKNMGDNLDWLGAIFEDVMKGVDSLSESFSGIDTGTIDALKTAFSSAYTAIKDLASLAIDDLKLTVGAIDGVLKALFSFMITAEQAKEGVSGFKKALDAVNIVIGLLDDGFKAISIAMKLLVGVVYDLGASFVMLRSYFAFGAEKDQFIADAKEMSEKASKYYGDAQKDLMDFQSSTVKAGIEANKSQKELNADKVANSKAALDKIIEDEKNAAEAKAKVQTESVKNHEKLDADLRAALISGNAAAVDAIKLQIADLDKTEKEAAKSSVTASEDKQKAAQKYVEQLIAGNKGVLTGEMQRDLIAQGFIVTQEKLGAVTVKAFQAVSAAVVDTSAQLKRSADEAAKSLGLDMRQAATGISDAFLSSKGNVDKVIASTKALGYTAEESAKLVYAAMANLVEKAKTKEELELVRLKFIELGKDGKLSSDLVAGGLALVSQQLQKVKGDIDPVSAAFKELGIQTKEQLKLASLAAQNAFDVVRKSGLATADDLQKAAEKNMQLATASGDASVIASAKAQAAQAGLIVTIDDTGKSIVQTNKEFVESSDEATSGTHRLAQGYADAGVAGVNAADAVRQAWAKAKAEQDAAYENHGKDVGSALNGVGLQAYNVKDVTDKLTALGFSISDATAKATVMVRDANQNLVQHQGKGNWFGDGGLSAYDLTNGASLDAELQKIGAQKAQDDARSGSGGFVLGSSGLADQSTASSSLNQNATKTVKYNITIGGQTATLYGDAGSEDQTNALLSQLEMLKKGSA